MRLVWKYKLDHVAFWAVVVFFYVYLRLPFAGLVGDGWFFGDVLVRNGLLILLCYLNIDLLFEKLFRKSEYLGYTLALLILLIIYSWMQYQVDRIVRTEAGLIDAEYKLLPQMYYQFSIGLFYSAFTLSLQLSKRWYQQTLQLHKLQAEKLRTELDYLKAQLNPHFLFNSINTIYFQIDRQNLAARESLEKFSELLRYQLYECNEDRISIEKELLYLESYVGLQKLRFSDNRTIQLRAEESVGGFDIAPLLLLPFVENGFKHMPSDPKIPGKLDINLSRKENRFRFTMKNSLDPKQVSLHDGNPVESSGIGLKNVRRRLELLYPGHHSLQIRQDDQYFFIDLSLDII